MLAQTFIADLLKDLPVGVHVVVLGGLLIGAIVCLAGGRLIRPLITLIGASIGAFMGLTAMAILPDTIDPLIGMGVGAVIGAIIGFALFRYYMAISLAILFGVAAPLGVLAYGSITGHWADQPIAPLTTDEMLLDDVPTVETDEPAPDDAPEPATQTDDDDAPPPPETAEPAEGTDVDEPVPDAADILADVAGSLIESADLVPEETVSALDLAGDVAEQIDESTKPIRESARKVIREILSQCQALWGDLPSAQQRVAGAASVIGLLLGVIIGLFLPESASSIVTAAAGSAVMLGCGTWLAARYQVPILKGLGGHSTAILTTWVVLTVLSIVFQWTISHRSPDD
ncbi:MAG: hypothetical protein KAS72_04910 [Phycisphaerales bacterium]|nr:hypothetical protein [Phycisphaerales bacterium]